LPCFARKRLSTDLVRSKMLSTCYYRCRRGQNQRKHPSRRRRRKTTVVRKKKHQLVKMKKMIDFFAEQRHMLCHRIPTFPHNVCFSQLAELTEQEAVNPDHDYLLCRAQIYNLFVRYAACLCENIKPSINRHASRNVGTSTSRTRILG
jgi:hypothetical protein